MGQPVIIIFIVIVIAILLIFGVRVILRTRDTTQKMAIEAFYNDLDEKVSEVYHLDYGSSFSLGDISVPSSIVEICFIDLNRELTGLSGEKEIYLTAAQENGKNVVFISNKGDYDSRKIDHFMINQNPLCESLLDRKLDLVLESAGTYVQIKR